jgi:hypothetical protein
MNSNQLPAEHPLDPEGIYAPISRQKARTRIVLKLILAILDAGLSINWLVRYEHNFCAWKYPEQKEPRLYYFWLEPMPSYCAWRLTNCHDARSRLGRKFWPHIPPPSAGLYCQGEQYPRHRFELAFAAEDIPTIIVPSLIAGIEAATDHRTSNPIAPHWIKLFRDWSHLAYNQPAALFPIHGCTQQAWEKQKAYRAYHESEKGHPKHT